jgi:hypothetical protein
MILLTPGKRPEAQKDSQMQRLKKGTSEKVGVSNKYL